MRLQVKRCVGPGAWYVLGPRPLRGTSFWVILGCGRFEVAVRRGQ